MRKIKQTYIGQQCNDWKVISDSTMCDLPGSNKIPKAQAYQAWCKCKCGKIQLVKRAALLSGRSKSCKGCTKWLGVPPDIRNTHYGMLVRCHDLKNPAYRWYGGRGIIVRPEWWDIRDFYRDMGCKPSKAHSIDRIDNDGDYCEQNCRWATSSQQANNTRRNVNIPYRGQIKTLSEWADELDIQVTTLRDRLSKGWQADKLFRSPKEYRDRANTRNSV